MDSVMLLQRLADDDELRGDFRRDPTTVMDMFGELSPEERRAFGDLDLDDLEELIKQGPQPIECRILRITW